MYRDTRQQSKPPNTPKNTEKNVIFSDSVFFGVFGGLLSFARLTWTNPQTHPYVIGRTDRA